MSLIDIRTELAAQMGRNIDNVRDKAWLDKLINSSAKEMYDGNELVGCLMEQVFNMDTTYNQISLPFYVGEIRGLRFTDTKQRVVQHDMIPRYATRGWFEFQYQGLNYRNRGLSPISQDMDNAGPLTLSIPAPDDVASFTVNIAGATATAGRVNESVPFTINSTMTAQTTNSFIISTSPQAISSIKKSATTKYDMMISDANGNILSVIPNNELEVFYKIIQIYDFDQQLVNNCQNCIDCLFKQSYIPLVNDYDNFQCRGYDKAIFWKVIEDYFALQIQGENVSANAKTKCLEIIQQLADDSELGKELPLDTGMPRYQSLDGYESATWRANREWRAYRLITGGQC